MSSYNTITAEILDAATTAYYDQGYKVARVGVGEAVAERLRA